jgi:hypothetical protein
MKRYRAEIRLFPEIYLAENETQAEQMLENYKEQIAQVVSKIEFRDYHLSVYEEREAEDV